MVNIRGKAIVLSAVYVLCLSFSLFWGQIPFYALVILPFVILMLGLLVLKPEVFLKALIFLIPLSVTLSEMGFSKTIDLSLPTEPLMFLLLLLLILHEGLYGSFKREFILHPVTLVILFILGWSFITSLTSTMILVSAKNFVAKSWFIGTGFFAMHLLFKNKKQHMEQVAWLYILSLTGVILYTLVNHFFYGFTEDTADWVSSPFYKDHTVYGACVAISFPVLVGFIFRTDYKGWKKFTIVLLTAIHLMALMYSYTRAAWLSVAVALVLLVILLMKIRFRTLMLIAGIGIGGAILFQTEIIMLLSSNKQDSEVSNIGKNLQSVSNISTDVSNLERINRWSCALRMFKDKPFLGFGPGTYMFKYAPYQLRKDKTVISTDMANGGNAHSEYLGPLCEQGVPGAIAMITLLLIISSLGFSLAFANCEKNDKIFITSVFLGLITYFAHGFLNNYLDVDKAAIPFWTFIAILVTYDIRKKVYLKPPTPMIYGKNGAEK